MLVHPKEVGNLMPNGLMDDFPYAFLKGWPYTTLKPGYLYGRFF